MGKKQMSFTPKGMNRDLSVSKFNPEFAFENRNLRLSTNEGNTMLSWVNEKGPKKLEFEVTSEVKLITGIPIGNAVINDLLVLFTTTNISDTDLNTATNPDYIYLIKYNGDKTKLIGKELFNGNLKFSVKHPLETLVSYESESILKVYWTDGDNEPGVVNITANNSYVGGTFTPEMNLTEVVTVTKKFDSSGYFPSGVIQYCFTYLNKYLLETNVFYTTPLLYIAPKDRGGRPDESVLVVFEIKIENVDTNFLYLRTYSILRQSFNGPVLVKRISDIEIPKGSNNSNAITINLVDTNTTGEAVDSTKLLLSRNREVVSQTIAQKDGTFFSGNLKVKDSIRDLTLYKDIFNENFKEATGKLKNISCALQSRSFTPYDSDNFKYAYNTLVAREGKNFFGSSGFKAREYYRLGILLLYKNGIWTDVYFLGDLQWTKTKLGFKGPGLHTPEYTDITLMYVPIFIGTLGKEYVDKLYDKGYRRIRPVYAEPTPAGRTIICLGIACPTMYSEAVGYNGIRHPSWFFRIKSGRTNDFNVYTKYGALNEDFPLYNYGVMQYKDHSFKTKAGDDTTRMGNMFEVEKYVDDYGNITTWDPYRLSTEIQSNIPYHIDYNTITLHSPDIECNELTTLPTYFLDCSLKWVGDINMTAATPSIRVIMSTSPIANVATSNPYGPSGLVPVLESEIASGSSTSYSIGVTYLNIASYCSYINPLLFRDGIVYYDEDGNFKWWTHEPQSETSSLYPRSDRYIWPLYLWHRNGSINNDVHKEGREGTALFEKKVISHYRKGSTPDWGYPAVTNQDISFKDIKLCNIGNENIIKLDDGTKYAGNPNISITQQEGEDGRRINNLYCFLDTTPPSNKSIKEPIYLLSPGIRETRDEQIYYPNCLWYVSSTGTHQLERIGEYMENLVYQNEPVNVKFSSSTHLVISGISTFQWSGRSVYPDTMRDGTLPIFELSRKYNASTFFGGNGIQALREIKWIPCGDSVNLNKETTGNTEIFFEYGDTYFQWYECLKTYPTSTYDKNQVIEVGGFVLESRINLDGRYDNNKFNNTPFDIDDANFNKINPVYSLQDNYFSYHTIQAEDKEEYVYPNTFSYSLSKANGAEEDVWLNTSLNSTFDIDGSCGLINKIINFNNKLYIFLDTGIALILYNENTLIATKEGAPIEIVNSGKVQGIRYITNTIGCNNKWSIAQTIKGIYFIDSNNKSLYLLSADELLHDLTTQFGFNTWAKLNILTNTKSWNPFNFAMQSYPELNFISCYDKLNLDILIIGSKEALAFSEKFSVFTSFYDYGSIPYFCNLEDTGIWIKPVNNSVNNTATYNTELWKHNAGEYCKFFDTPKPYSMALVGNPEPLLNKIFTNLEFRATIEGEGDTINNRYQPYVPFDSLEAWNEYQHGLTSLLVKDGHDSMVHDGLSSDGLSSSLLRKFRIWRCDIPRNNYEWYAYPVKEEGETEEEYQSRLAEYNEWYNGEVEKGISRHIRKPMDRMRNPWIYLKLKKGKDTSKKVEIHDIMMTYFT